MYALHYLKFNLCVMAFTPKISVPQETQNSYNSALQ